MRIPIYGGKKINHRILKTEGTFIRMSFETISQHYTSLWNDHFPALNTSCFVGSRVCLQQLWFILWYWAEPCLSINPIPVPQFCSLRQHRTLCCSPSSEYLKMPDMCSLASSLSQANCCEFSQHWSMTVSDLSLLMEHTLNYNVSHYSAKLELKPHVVGQAHNPLAGML